MCKKALRQTSLKPKHHHAQPCAAVGCNRDVNSFWSILLQEKWCRRPVHSCWDSAKTWRPERTAPLQHVLLRCAYREYTTDHPPSAKMLMCRDCKRVSYCCKEHQEADAPTHDEECGDVVYRCVYPLQGHIVGYKTRSLSILLEYLPLQQGPQVYPLGQPCERVCHACAVLPLSRLHSGGAGGFAIHLHTLYRRGLVLQQTAQNCTFATHARMLNSHPQDLRLPTLCR